MTPTLPREWAGKLQTQGGRAKLSKGWRDEAAEGGVRGVSPCAPPHPAASTYFWMIWGRPAGGGGGGGCIPRGPGAVGAGAPGTLRASLSGCSEPLGSASWLMAAASTGVKRELPRLAAKERARGAAPGHRRSLAGVPVPSPLVLPGGAGRRRERRGRGCPGGAASSSSSRSASPTRPRCGGG